MPLSHSRQDGSGAAALCRGGAIVKTNVASPAFDASAMTPEARIALERAGFSRRGFLKSAGALIVGFSMAGRARKSAAQTTAPFQTVNPAQVDSWIAIGADGIATGYSGKCDFGQGFGTVQVQLIAEELSLPLDRVRLIACDTAQTPDQGVTSGSQSSPTQF